MSPRRISILGVGLLGGSIGLACRKRLSDAEVVGYGHRAQTLEAALQMGAIGRAAHDPRRSVEDADLIILCTPVSTLPSLLAEIAPSLKAGAIVTDVGSTKRSVVEAGEKLLKNDGHFVGSHPMAGSEKRGVEFARADLFDHAFCLVTPTERTRPDAVEFVEKFWQILGMRTSRLSPAEHDRRLAEVSHLPHALAAAMVSMADSESLDLAGKGFLDLTRVAGGDGGLWRDILLDNRENVCASLAKLKQTLEELEGLIRREESAPLKDWLDRAARRREEMKQKR